MYLRKRGKTWEYRFELPRINGKRQSPITKGGFKTKKAAEQAGILRQNELITTGKVLPDVKKPFNEVADIFFENYKKNNKLTSYSRYYSAYNKHIKPVMENYLINNVPIVVLQELVDDVYRNNSNTLIDGVTYVLKNTFDYAIYPLQYINNNPMTFIKVKHHPSENNCAYFTIEQLKSIFEYFKTTQYCDVLSVLLMTGMRIGELLGLTWENVDFKNKKIYITGKISNVGAIHYYDTPKTPTSIRELILIDEMENILLKLYSKKDSYKFKNYINGNIIISSNDNLNLPQKNFVFVNNDGCAIKYQTFRYNLATAGNKLGFKIKSHMFRKTYASLLYGNGANAKALQYMLGHKNFQTTFNSYIAPLENNIEENTSILTNIIYKNNILSPTSF